MASGNTSKPPGEMLGEAERRRFADLMAAVADRQDRTAYSELFAYYAPRVKSYLMRLGADAAQGTSLVPRAVVFIFTCGGDFVSFVFDRLGSLACTHACNAGAFATRCRLYLDPSRGDRREQFAPS